LSKNSFETVKIKLKDLGALEYSALKAWLEKRNKIIVKNMFFNDAEFWKFSEWKNRYVELLSEAKKHKAFQNYFPFTSHYWLRFSIDKQMKETWTLDTYIIPTMYSDEIPTTLGKFYVSYNDKPMGGQFFDTVKEALDFYAEKLEETKPIRWVAQ
jgi:hypothetical protein